MTLEGTNTYVVGEGGRAWVIDPGPDDPAHLAAVRKAGERRGGIAGVLLTHSHSDHAAGVDRLAAPRLPASEGPFEAVPTPGHSPDHVCFVYGRVCFCGDLILGSGSSFVPPDGGSLAAYLDSLERMRGLELELLCPGHGPYVTEPRAKIDEYLAHRLEREQKLLAALAEGVRSRRELLDRAWDDVPGELRAAAGAVMQAHLEKLEAERRLPNEPLTD
jgi:glyoxylase-like metal-dependent hydrolase (beta-lactamase superfamily II)